ncbi:hypothetical protein DVH24_011766 [Malus domestica]|uniref:Uncharacterized protein n=1 Tax=Malus domestica TaxID=3750 RepID=A0A498K2B4_MALDO|nr:hypothetical protein DVH24_011766 [Malus domestica]
MEMHFVFRLLPETRSSDCILNRVSLYNSSPTGLNLNYGGKLASLLLPIPPKAPLHFHFRLFSQGSPSEAPKTGTFPIILLLSALTASSPSLLTPPCPVPASGSISTPLLGLGQPRTGSISIFREDPPPRLTSTPLSESAIQASASADHDSRLCKISIDLPFALIPRSMTRGSTKGCIWFHF